MTPQYPRTRKSFVAALMESKIVRTVNIICYLNVLEKLGSSEYAIRKGTDVATTNSFTPGGARLPHCRQEESPFIGTRCIAGGKLVLFSGKDYF